MTLKFLAMAALAAAHPHPKPRLLAARAPVAKAVAMTPMADQNGRPLPANLPGKQMTR